jgi:serine/threonine protein kinase
VSAYGTLLILLASKKERSYIKITMTAELKNHIIGSIKRIGTGAYSDAFKIYYDVELCVNGTNVIPFTLNSKPTSLFLLPAGRQAKREQNGREFSGTPVPGQGRSGSARPLHRDSIPVSTVCDGEQALSNVNNDKLRNVSVNDSNPVSTVPAGSSRCIKCISVYKKSSFLVLKEIQFTDKFGKLDFELECKYHELAYKYMPDLIVKLYDSWIEKYMISPADTLLETRYGIQETKRLPATHIPDDYIDYGYCVLEYMNYKDLYLNYTLSRSIEPWQKPINMVGLVLICVVLIYNLHCKLHICHGDIRDTNIFLSYIGPEYMQSVYIELPDVKHKLLVDTGGFHVKLGDFSLADELISNTKSFIFRDYEILDNIYQLRANWQWMVPDILQYNKLLNFLRIEFIHPINERMVLSNISIENPKQRRDFWYTRHYISENSIYLYKYPAELLVKYLNVFYPALSK